MAVRQKEWMQSEWRQAGVDLHRARGDFYTLNSLIPTLDRSRLERGPAWSAHVTFPAGFTVLTAILYDNINAQYHFYGTLAGELAGFVADVAFAAGAAFSLTVATTNLGGVQHRNIVRWGSKIYAIGADSKVYQGTFVPAGLAVIYAIADAMTLSVYGDRVILTTTGGKVLRLNDARDGFDAHFTPLGSSFVVPFTVAFRRNLCLFVQGIGSNLSVYYLSPPPILPTQFQHVAYVPITGAFEAAPASPPKAALFAVHGDKIYFTSLPYSTPTGAAVDLFSFNGSQVERICRIQDIDVDAGFKYAALLSWYGTLLLYALEPGNSKTQTFKILVGDSFTDLSVLTLDEPAGPYAAVLGDTIIVTGDPAAAEGFYHADRSALADGYLITSRLDMDRPGRQKRLLRLTVLLDGAAADFNVIIKYRRDDTAAWTTAVTSDDTQRVTVDIATDVWFYTLQLRVDLDDNTGNNEDIRISAVSVVYSVPD